MFRQWLEQTLKERYPGHLFDVLVPPEASMGDYSVNLAFVLAKSEKKNPREVAQAICAWLLTLNSEQIADCQVAGPGFVNVFLKDEYLRAQLGQAAIPNTGQGKKVIVEYSAPNIAKPMSVGHLRSTIIGDALANVFSALGYQVVRWNYLGDWGTQFGKLIAAWRLYGGAKLELTINNLTALYVRFHQEAENNPELEKQGQEEFRKLEAGDVENRKLWELFRKESLDEFQRMYDQLGVKFDVVRGESDYEQNLAGAVVSLKSHLVASQGAQVMMLDEFGLPPAIIQKSDGSSIYITRDVASLQDRLEHYQPAKILYVVGNEQALHFDQLFAIAQKIHLSHAELVHVKFGLILGDDRKKFSTRRGNAVLLTEVIDKVVAMAAKRNPDTAEAIGIGALKYNDLRQHPHSDIVFDWEAMLDLGGNSGPYLQYTYARLASILAKAGNFQFSINNLQLLNHPTERALMRHLLDFGHAVAQCAHLYALNGLALYLYQLAELSNRYYEEVHVLNDDQAERLAARVFLLKSVMAVLQQGLSLLGIGVLDRI